MYCVYCGHKNEDGINTCGKCEVELKPLIDIESLSYTKLPADYADVIKQGKAGLFGKSNLKHFTGLIESGSVEYAQLRVEAYYIDDSKTDSEGDRVLESCCKIQSLDCDPIIQSAQPIDKFKPDNMTEAYLIRVSFKKKFKYMVIESLDSSYLIENVKGIIKFKDYELFDRPLPYNENPGLLDKAISKGIDFIASKFSKDN